MDTTYAEASPIAIRRARPGDAKGIENLYGELVDSANVCVLPERIAELEDDPRTSLLVMEDKGVLHTTALLIFCADVMYATQPFAIVENIVVSVASRGRGLGTAFLRHIEEECIARDCTKIMLLSAVERGRAHNFFERCGFSGSKKKGFVKYRRAFRNGAGSSPVSIARKT